MSDEELLDLDLVSVASLIRQRAISPVDVTRSALERIERVDPRLRAFITVTRDTALEAARVAEHEILHGTYRGPLHGMPLGLKDVIATRGVRTTSGSKLFADSVPDHDAAVTERLRAAGAVLVGKNNMHELAMGSTTDNPYFGTCRNPWNLEHVPGGSSGGSGAAVAAGLCFGAIGSDTGGSVRSPASQCGVVGLKPTFGLVSRHGVFPVSASLDHVGPLARTVADTALILQAIVGHDPRDPGSCRTAEDVDYAAELDRPIAGLRVGIPRDDYFDRLGDDVRALVHAAVREIAALGASMVEVGWPSIEQAPAAVRTIMSVEAARAHRPWLRSRAEDYSPDVRRRIELGVDVDPSEHAAAQRVRGVLQREFGDLMTRVDALVTATNPVAAPRIGQERIELGGESRPLMDVMPRLGLPHNLTGCPAVSVPCGFTSAGVPVGLQIVGRAFEEPTILRLARAYEQATPWHRRRPPTISAR
jgi:aspartyl-tRNA(Asn)/glutamyl-tRNA(Gln) amidotransferase subunit A